MCGGTGKINYVEEMEDIKPAAFIVYPTPGEKYRHYKGGLYEVMFLSKHSETGEVLVNYKSLLFGSYVSRPLSMWFDTVEIEQGQTYRFSIVE